MDLICIVIFKVSIARCSRRFNFLTVKNSPSRNLHAFRELAVPSQSWPPDQPGVPSIIPRNSTRTQIGHSCLLLCIHPGGGNQLAAPAHRSTDCTSGGLNNGCKLLRTLRPPQTQNAAPTATKKRANVVHC